ncbi:hypothetical protein BCV70DRAFT_230933 [Testicularia cyperi]|uniref:Uncharacterized protein n=1 Tax=Testicularia cyperi TaxID=1882483 RepID=A0A317XRJ0_9BASI|nr:hypothetical protein BCV70DRAFT_230933 [Testicularia cyperi]
MFIPPFLQRWILLNALRVATIVSCALCFASGVVVLRSNFSHYSSSSTANAEVDASGYVAGTDIPASSVLGVFWSTLHHVFLLAIMVVVVISELSLPIPSLNRCLFKNTLPFLGPNWGTGVEGALLVLLAADTLSRAASTPLTKAANWTLAVAGTLNIASGVIWRAKAKLLRSPSAWKLEVAKKMEQLAEAKRSAEKVGDADGGLPLPAVCSDKKVAFAKSVPTSKLGSLLGRLKSRSDDASAGGASQQQSKEPAAPLAQPLLPTTTTAPKPLDRSDSAAAPCPSEPHFVPPLPSQLMAEKQAAKPSIPAMPQPAKLGPGPDPGPGLGAFSTQDRGAAGRASPIPAAVPFRIGSPAPPALPAAFLHTSARSASTAGSSVRGASAVQTSPAAQPRARLLSLDSLRGASWTSGSESLESSYASDEEPDEPEEELLSPPAWNDVDRQQLQHKLQYPWARSDEDPHDEFTLVHPSASSSCSSLPRKLAGADSTRKTTRATPEIDSDTDTDVSYTRKPKAVRFRTPSTVSSNSTFGHAGSTPGRKENAQVGARANVGRDGMPGDSTPLSGVRAGVFRNERLDSSYPVSFDIDASTDVPGAKAANEELYLTVPGSHKPHLEAAGDGEPQRSPSVVECYERAMEAARSRARAQKSTKSIYLGSHRWLQEYSRASSTSSASTGGEGEDSVEMLKFQRMVSSSGNGNGSGSGGGGKRCSDPVPVLPRLAPGRGQRRDDLVESPSSRPLGLTGALEHQPSRTKTRPRDARSSKRVSKIGAHRGYESDWECPPPPPPLMLPVLRSSSRHKAAPLDAAAAVPVSGGNAGADDEHDQSVLLRLQPDLALSSQNSGSNPNPKLKLKPKPKPKAQPPKDRTYDFV